MNNKICYFLQLYYFPPFHIHFSILLICYYYCYCIRESIKVTLTLRKKCFLSSQLVRQQAFYFFYCSFSNVNIYSGKFIIRSTEKRFLQFIQIVLLPLSLSLCIIVLFLSKSQILSQIILYTLNCINIYNPNKCRKQPLAFISIRFLLHFFLFIRRRRRSHRINKLKKFTLLIKGLLSHVRNYVYLTTILLLLGILAN